MSDVVERYVKAHGKSQATGVILTIFLGPLGLFYSSWVAAVILIGIAFVSVASVVGPIACWIISIPVSIGTVSGHNNKVRAAADLRRPI